MLIRIYKNRNISEGTYDTLISKLNRMGTHHASIHGDNEDVVYYGNNRDLYVISLADGVSACSAAKQGASIAGREITNLFLKKGTHFLEYETEQIADFALSHILYELKAQARGAARPVEDYSSTVASVLIDKKKQRMLCFNLGDSMILAAGNGKCRVLSMPADSSRGCCVTTTRHAEQKISVSLCGTGSLDSVMICSDGAWREMFLKNRLRPEVARMLADNDYAALERFLVGRNCFDDYSFISLDMRENGRRRHT